MVFNANALTPYSRSSIIYDIDYRTQTAILAQPHTPFTKNTRFKELHITTISQYKQRRIRIGLKCSAFKIIKEYPLANRSNVPAVQFKYDPPAIEVNIRSAFRLSLSNRYMIKGKILHESMEYNTPRDFSIKNVSLSGLGIIVPNLRGKTHNPLSQIKMNSNIMVGIVLIDTQEKAPNATLPLKAEVTRINPKHSETHTSIGLKILDLGNQNESILNQFIHTAQIEELKKLSRRNA